MGTPKDYEDYYLEKRGTILNNAFTAIASAMCLGWQLGVERAGAEWKNSSQLITAMHSLQMNDSTTETFFGRWQFDQYGKNIAKKSVPTQYLNGEIQVIHNLDQLVYPAQWSWIQDEEGDGTNVETTIGIIVGVIGGTVFLIGVVAAIGVVGFLVVKRMWFHMILLPKGDTVREATADL